MIHITEPRRAWRISARALCILAAALAVFGNIPCASANVFLAKDEALALAFPSGVEVSERTILLSSEQKYEVEQRAQTKLSSNLFHFFEGKIAGQVSGYAVIDSRLMRSNLAVFMVVLDPQFTVQKVVVLAFNEPLEYMPAEGWYKHLEGARPVTDLIPGQGIPPIAGSTLSANGLSDGVRAVRASFEAVRDTLD